MSVQKKTYLKKPGHLVKKVNARAFYVEKLFCFLPIYNPFYSSKSTIGAHGHDHGVEGDEDQSGPGKTGGEDGSQRHDHDGINVG